MSYSVRDRMKHIARRQMETRGEFGKYTRKNSSILIRACPGHTDVQDLSPTAVTTQIRYVDFIITAADLNLPGVGLTLPERGDLWEWEGNTYTVTAPTDTDDVYNFTTMYRDRIRFHTLLTTDASES